MWRTFESPGSFSAVPGKGVKYVVDATSLCIGTSRWIDENGVIATAAAQEKLGDIILMKSNLHDVAVGVHLSRRTLTCIKWNFTWAFMYNLLAVPIAMGVYYPAGGVAVPPALAGLSELLSS